jgi:hypothetical protein
MMLGRTAISPGLYRYIKKVLPKGSTLLELGSGAGTAHLAEFYKMYSVEDKEEWLGKHNSTYIHAPLVRISDPLFPDMKSWYDPEVLKRKLPKKYDALLIDGPRGHRGGVITHWDLFLPDVPIFIDDVQAPVEWKVARVLAKQLKQKELLVHDVHASKCWVALNVPVTRPT